jgi:hypothetical protein
MAIVTMLHKARQGRRNALASLATREKRSDNVVSIFDFAFEETQIRASAPATGSNVIAFRSARRAAAPAPIHAERRAA